LLHLKIRGAKNQKDSATFRAAAAGAAAEEAAGTGAGAAIAREGGELEFQ